MYAKPFLSLCIKLVALWCVIMNYCSCSCLLLQDAELESNQPLEKVSIDDILEAQRVQQEEREKEKKKRENILRARGMRPLDQGEDTVN